MERPEAFRGPVFADMLAWATGGLVAGGVFGYVTAEIFNRLKQPTTPKDPVWVGNRDAYRGAVFFGLVALSGHALRAIF